MHYFKTHKNLIILAFLTFIIFVCRIISFRENSLDPDELEYLYSVRRCLIDPRPFVGFDSHRRFIEIGKGATAAKPRRAVAHHGHGLANFGACSVNAKALGKHGGILRKPHQC